ncbi:hypothetical protein [Bradyrhizobium liaoningense]|uniref:hypothetical protein n=1 Tax=Bradyrhizobium liaoningense TaxID=43992 RepID=UPI001BAC9CF8|nr:hypothetical protein [Bradyrhizobium liaoningense]MBR0945962.1 hypothetical protein [Bradyrhizobium liaoningense]
MSSVTLAPTFDWNEEPIAVPRQRAIAVHLTEQFDVVIRQQGESGAPDAVIEIARQNCLALCAKILREAGELEFQIMQLPHGVMLTGDGRPVHIPRAIAEKLFDQVEED